MELEERDPGTYRYSRLHQDDPVYTPPPGYNHPTPNTITQPAPPPSSSQQSSSNNVVVVSQPSSSQPQTTTVIERIRPNDYLILTLGLMIVCCVLGNPMAFILLIPALILSLSSGCASNAGDYDTAQHYGKVACCCALSTLVISVVAVVVITIVITLVFFTVGITVTHA